MSVRRRRVALAAVLALTAAAGMVALTVSSGGNRDVAVSPDGQPTGLRLTRDGREVRACLGTGARPRCIEAPRDRGDLEATLDHWPDAGSSVLLVLAPDDLDLDLTLDAGPKRIEGFVAATVTLEGRPACVAFAMVRPGADEAAEVRVHLTVAGDGEVGAIAADRPCQRLD